jgi:MerR family redox-sensitive transcriptional activator SoxR
MSWMTIGQVARRAALRPSAVRYYEKLGLLPAAQRVNGRRRYDERVLERLAVLRFARFVGFTLREVKVLVHGLEDRPPPPRWREMAARKMAQVDALIARAQTVKALLRDTLAHRCPMLAERGGALLISSRGSRQAGA